MTKQTRLSRFVLQLFCLPRLYFPALFALLLLTGPAAAQTEKREITLICDIWPPYQIEHPAGLTGFSVSLVKEALRRMEAGTVHIKAFPWKRALFMLGKGRADGLFSAGRTPEREQAAYYPEIPLVMSQWVFWTNDAGPKTLRSFQDLDGLRIGVVRGYSYTPEFWNYLLETGNFEEAKDDETNFKKLARNRIDATVAELNNARYLLRSLGIRNLVPHTSFPIKTDGLYCIFSRNRMTESFTRKFSEELEAMQKDGTHQKIYDLYFMED